MRRSNFEFARVLGSVLNDVAMAGAESLDDDRRKVYEELTRGGSAMANLRRLRSGL